MTYHASDEGQGAGVVADWLELVTAGQVSCEGYVCGNVLSGIHSVASLAQSIDGGLSGWEDNLICGGMHDACHNLPLF